MRPIKNSKTYTPLLEPGVEPIITRLKPCNCGCKGQDPWHKPTIRRKVREVEPVAVPDDPRGWATVAKGKVKMPWGFEEVIAEVLVYRDGRLGVLADWRLRDYRR